jgi:hypothetical protein
MHWKAPLNFGGMNFRGKIVTMLENGVADLSEFAEHEIHALVGDLASHGFTPIELPAPSKPSAPPATAPKEDAGGAQTGDQGDEANQAPQEEAGFDAAAASAEDIDAMNRNELFAYLKARGVAVQLPIKNDKLRELAHAAQ